ncbi:MAG: type II toxin-antitoxin system PemK/MazF family toxin [Chloroflexi bacterium]|nr:type II toxin-antitoxin system PemK/MazF family toxin [Chloroflexota bacterium]
MGHAQAERGRGLGRYVAPCGHRCGLVRGAPAQQVVVTQGDVWRAKLPRPAGSEPGFERPVVVVQGNAFNRSDIRTVVVVPVTRTVRLGSAPGNVVLPAGSAGLPHDSVANVSQVVTLDRRTLRRRIGQLSAVRLAAVLSGIDVVLGR